MLVQALTAKQARFIDEYLVDANGAAAAVRAGYALGSAKVAASRMLSKDNPVRRVIQARQASDSRRLGVTRDGVISRLLEAFDVAKRNEEPAAMVRAASELGKLMGYYLPERVNLEITATGGRQAYELMSDAELMAIVGNAA